MGLASKLQASQAGGGGGTMPAPAGAMAAPPGGALPSAPPLAYPPSAPPGAPYPPGTFAGPAGQYAAPGAPPYPTPYGSAPPGPAASAHAAAFPAGYPAPSAAAPPGYPPPAAQPPMQQHQQQPPMQQQQQQLGQGPGFLGGTPPFQQQQQPQQPYCAPPSAPPAGAAGAPGGMQASILAKLQSIAATNQLQRFYPPQALQALAARLDGRVNFRDLAARWGMPVELALDLAALALYDVVLVADDSGSMAFEENGERIEDLKLIAQKVSEVATLFDDDGILVRFMNSPVEGNAVRSPADVGALLAQVQYAGLTPLAASLQSRVLQPIVFSLAASGQLAKPVLVITITDGEPTDNPKDLVVQVIKDARNRLAAQYGPMAVAFEFCQVGKDQRAQAFLARLDTDPQVGNSIDCTSYYEMESAEYMKRGVNLSPAMWLVKMMCGAIDPSYDEADE